MAFHRLISVLIPITCCMLVLSAEISSSSHPEDQLFVSDSLQPHLLPNFWHRPALLSNISQENSEKTWEMKRQLQAEATNMISLKLIHRTSAQHPLSERPPHRGHILKELIDADAVRLQGYTFTSRSNTGLLASRNFGHKSIKASLEKPENSGVAFDRISSGAALGLGQYLADVYIGSPAKKYSLIIDTGSDLIWVQCIPCRKCFPQTNPMLHPRDSSSFSYVPCTSQRCLLVPAPANGAFCDPKSPTSCKYTYMYTDDTSTTGILASETVKMMACSGQFLQISNITFGCGFRNQGPSLLGSNGVLGLGGGPLSFTSQLGYRFGSKFSYCLVNHLQPTTESSLLIFGNANIRDSLKDKLQYTPLLKNQYAETYYYVCVQHVSVNGKILPIRGKEWGIDANGYGGTIVDSGTTLTYFRIAAYSAIMSAFRDVITLPRVTGVPVLDVCYNFSTGSLEQIPQFSFQLRGDVKFHPPPENYFIDVAPDVKCLAMQGVASPLGSNTIGNLMQQNFLVEYDRLHARLGFVQAKCSSAL